MAHPKFLEKFNLRSQLHFDMGAGRIWLGENRMVMLHTKAMAQLRREIFDRLDPHVARGMLVRLGFTAGQLDGELIAKHRADADSDDYDAFLVGPELRALEGCHKATILDTKIDWESGNFHGEVRIVDSWEAEAELRDHGVGHDPACWSVAGYASGYCSQFFKRFIVFREVACTAQGAESCLIVGKPAEEWGSDYTAYFRPDQADHPLHHLEAELRCLRARSEPPKSAVRAKAPARNEGLIGSSPGFRSALELARKAAASKITVLLLGETGVGKEVFANWLHKHSDRADQPFVAINCGAIPQDLIESELFGVQKGAYTGAQQSRPGRFERADGGTLFLDEVGDLTPAAQVKLLRVLQTGEVERLGDDKVRKVNVRLVAATNVDLHKAIAEGRFRADLYYRLATYPISIPPLRERQTDIPLLAAAFVEASKATYGKTLPGFTDEAMRALGEHGWPGNVRELSNVIERAVLLAPDGGRIEREHLFADAESRRPTLAGVTRDGGMNSANERARNEIYDRLLEDGFSLEQHEQRLIELAVERAKGNLTHAARALGITRRQLAYRLKQSQGCAD